MQAYHFSCLDDDGNEIKTLVHQFVDDVSALESAIEKCRDFAINIFESGRHVARVNKGNVPDEIKTTSPFNGRIAQLADNHIKFGCPHCGQRGEVVWRGDGRLRELVRLSDGFHVEEGRLAGARHVIICDGCDEIDPPGLVKL